MKKILIIRFSSIGDIVLTTPVLRCLKYQLNDCEIHYVTKPAYACLLEHNPHIDKLFCLEKGLSKLAETLKKERYTHVIDLHNNIRSRFLTLKLGLKTVRVNKLNLRKWLLVNFKMNLMPAVHIVDRYLAACKPLGIQNDGGGLDFFLSEKALPNSFTLPEKPFVAWAIGGQHQTKVWPAAKVRAVCKGMNVPVVLLGDKYDAAKGHIIATGLTNVVNACGTLSIQESAFVISQSALVLSNDTGLMHIAAALRKPIISFWGSTVPAFGMSPFFPNNSPETSIIMQTEGLKCRPCSKIGFEVCPHKHFKCMEDISVEDTLKTIRNFSL